MFLKFCTIIIFCLVFESAAQYEGDSCTQDGSAGTCTLLRYCYSALNNHKTYWKTIHICGWLGEHPIICCTESNDATTTAKPVTSTTTPRYTYESSYLDDEECVPLPPNTTAVKTGRKAWDKCIEYQEQLVFPCERSVVLSRVKVRGNYCKQIADALIVGGKDAMPDEFPHMVLLGFEQANRPVAWKCGGTLLSDRFILTAGHCTYSKGPVTYASVGSLNQPYTVDSPEVYRIKRYIQHPEYKSPSQYHDIALLETETTIDMGPSVVPACLDVFGGDTSKVVATGWGAVAWAAPSANTLQKVNLTQFKEAECRERFPNNLYMKPGFDAHTQVCYGDYSLTSDTCQGDSGGPLTIKNPIIHCMYSVVGITSFGKKCGTAGVPGYYTKVSHYVPWIESVVWP